MFAISITDRDWFYFMRQQCFPGEVNFWTPTPWRLRRLSQGERFYFMLKSPVRKIGGFGLFVEYTEMTVDDAWYRFGTRNGRGVRAELIDILQKYVDKNSKKYRGMSVDSSKYRIGCIILKSYECWGEAHFMDPAEFGLTFGAKVMKMKYFDVEDPFRE